ncbi:MAG: hypothetical protein Q8J63_10360 [Candidatus Aquicultor sp.]|nr:hypothetical protein [Candidatus Aquicultor sp.]
MQRSIIAIVATLLVVSLVGCGSGMTGAKVGDKSTNTPKATTTTTESKTPNVEVVEHSDFAKQGTPLVEEFPETFPLIKGEVEKSAEASNVSLADGSKGEGYLTIIKSDAPTEEVVEFYKSQFSHIIIENPYNRNTKMAMYKGIIGNQVATIYFYNKNGKTEIEITMAEHIEKTDE